MTKHQDFTKYKPQSVFTLFKKLTEIPRCTFHMEKVTAYLKEFANTYHCDFQQDKAGNVRIVVPASKDRTKDTPLVLQAHLDMVCAKTENSTHNFATEPISVYEKDGYLTAKDTSLGADDGIGVACILSVVENQHTLVHPNLICIFTVNEEDDPMGVISIDPNWYKDASGIINVDSENINAISLGSASLISVIGNTTLQFEPADKFIGYTLSISGLPGGHSGINITQGHLSALNVLIDFMAHVHQTLEGRLVSFDVNNPTNLIAPKGAMTFAIPEHNKVKMHQVFQQLKNTYIDDNKLIDDLSNFKINLTHTPLTQVVTQKDTQRVLYTMEALPNGPIAFSETGKAVYDWIKGKEAKIGEVRVDLVDTSMNFSKVNVKDNTLTIEGVGRSNSNGRTSFLELRLKAIFSLGKFTYDITIPIDVWAYMGITPFVKQVFSSYETVLKRKAYKVVEHAGLETGTLVAKYYKAFGTHIDAVAIGPTIQNAHSTSERLEISTVKPLYEFLITFLSVYKNK